MPDPGTPNPQIDFTQTLPNQYSTVFIDAVGECNLRCVYCYQSDKNFKPHSGMSDAVVDAAIQFAKIYGDNSINVTSEGEFTFGKNWQAVAQRLLASGIAVLMTSNLARMLDPDEIEILSRFSAICLSLDSTDRETLRSIRRSADIRTISHNVLQIRAAAVAAGRSPTPFIVNTVLSTGNAATIPALVTYCAMLGMTCVSITPLHAFGQFGFDKEQLGEDRVDDPLEVWDLVKLKILHDDLVMAVNLAKRCKMAFSIAPAIVQRVMKKLNGSQSKTGLGPGLTRICTQPWDRVIVQSNGDVLPCCYGADSIGNISNQKFEDVVNGDKLVALKRSLLTGADLPSPCRNCVGEQAGTTEQLKGALQGYFGARTGQLQKAS